LHKYLKGVSILIELRKNKLIEQKIYISREKKSGVFLTQCQSRVLDKRIKESGIDFSEYNHISNEKTKITESIYRYVTNDKEEKLCKFCNTNRVEFISITSGWRDFCGSSCSSKNKVEDGTAWITKEGWKHSDETKEKMSKNHADFSGENNPFRNKINSDLKFRNEMKERKKEYWASLSEDKREEISEIFSKAQANSDKKSLNSHKNHKSGYFYSKKMKNKMFYRSSWELEVCEYLDQENNNIKEFQIEPFYIEYFLENGEKRYTRIDFHLTHYDGRQKILEVKPSSLLTFGNVPYKIQGCEKYAEKNDMKFIIITEIELKKLKEVLT
jgi:hypothetical protein